MDALNSLTNLVALHGVYALSVIFIFYQQRRAHENLARASGGPDKHYFRLVHASVVIATYVLVLISTLVWIYATFIYLPVRPVKGEVTGLRAPLAAPEGTLVHHQLAPELRGDVEFYPVNDPPVRNGEYRFRWVLLARENLRQVAFIFTQQAEVAADSSRFSPIATAGLDPAPSEHGRKVIELEKRFVLDLGAIRYSPTKAVHLTYKPDQHDPTNVGTLWLSNADGAVPVPIQWADGAAPAQARSVVDRLWGALSLPVFAAPIGAALFGKDGSYDVETARALQFQLGHADLRTRLSARQTLVENGSLAFRFILDTLDGKVSPKASDRAMLVDSLSKTIDEIELRGSRFPSHGHLKLAVALYEGTNFKSAAYHFDKAEAGGAMQDTQQVAMRAHAYLESDRYVEAIRTFNEYIAANISPQGRAWARDSLGFVYSRLGRTDDSIREHREALRLAPNYATALNNLSYTLAKRGETLHEALALVDRALRQERDNPYYLETRGYVLFRLGRLDEAADLIRRAMAKVPNDPDGQRDLKEVEEAIRLRRRSPVSPSGGARRIEP